MIACALVPWKAKALVPHISAASAFGLGIGASCLAAISLRLSEPCVLRVLSIWGLRLRRCSTGSTSCCETAR